MKTDTDEFRTMYADGLRTYLRDLDDHALHAAYELGRRAVEWDLTVLEMAAVHHEQLIVAACGAGDDADIERVTRAAGHFFLESLSKFEMVPARFSRDQRHRPSRTSTHGDDATAVQLPRRCVLGAERVTSGCTRC